VTYRQYRAGQGRVGGDLDNVDTCSNSNHSHGPQLESAPTPRVGLADHCQAPDLGRLGDRPLCRASR
jgi:hypothetical protein